MQIQNMHFLACIFLRKDGGHWRSQIYNLHIHPAYEVVLFDPNELCLKVSELFYIREISHESLDGRLS